MTSAGPSPQTYEGRTSWKSRPWLGRLLHIGLTLFPIIAAVLITVWFGRLVNSTGWSLWDRILWALGMFFTGSLVATAITRLLQRVLPLTALCHMNLDFPREAPSRLGMALRLGNVKGVDRVVEVFQEQGLADDPQLAAEQTLHLVSALNRHDPRTRGHSERVRALSDMIAAEMDLPERDRNLLRWGALLHDIGKLAVPRELLNKAGKPSHEEWETIKSHPAAGRSKIAPLEFWLGEFSRAVHEHHERFDGTGYPKQLAGDDIALGSRIVAVADAFEVMTARRSYKRPLSFANARAELVKCSGTHFDPAVVRALVQIGLKPRRFSTGFFSSWSSQALSRQPTVTSFISEGVAPHQVAGAFRVLSAAALTSSVGVATTSVAPNSAPRTQSGPQQLALRERPTRTNPSNTQVLGRGQSFVQESPERSVPTTQWSLAPDNAIPLAESTLAERFGDLDSTDVSFFAGDELAIRSAVVATGLAQEPATTKRNGPQSSESIPSSPVSTTSAVPPITARVASATTASVPLSVAPTSSSAPTTTPTSAPTSAPRSSTTSPSAIPETVTPETTVVLSSVPPSVVQIVPPPTAPENLPKPTVETTTVTTVKQPAPTTPPDTLVPTTVVPTTVRRSSTVASPSTVAIPSTVSPTTVSPTTVSPTTVSPTTVPSDGGETTTTAPTTTAPTTTQPHPTTTAPTTTQPHPTTTAPTPTAPPTTRPRCWPR